MELVGADNVVQVVMDNTGDNRVAGRLLCERYPKLSYTNCAAHCLDLAIEDIGKEKWVSKVIATVLIVVKFVKLKT